jgi:hypothetical protein
MDLYSLYSTDETIQIPYKYLQPPLPISAFSQHEGSVITLADSLGGAFQCHGDLMLSERITDGSVSNTQSIYFSEGYFNVSSVLNCSTNGLVTSSMYGANVTETPSIIFMDDCISVSCTTFSVNGVMNCETNRIVTTGTYGNNTTDIPSINFVNDNINVSCTNMNVSGVVNCGTNGIVTASMCGVSTTNTPSIKFVNSSVNVSGSTLNVSAACVLSYSDTNSSGLHTSSIPVIAGQYTWAKTGTVYVYSTVVNGSNLNTLAII